MPRRINDTIKQYRLKEEFQNSPHGGYFGIRKTLIKLIKTAFYPEKYEQNG